MAGEDGPEYLDKIASSKTILVRPFDELAAIEVAAIELTDRRKGDKRGGATAAWQKLKIDRQIVAIAKTNKAHTIYADDGDVRKFAEKIGIKVVSSWELPIPASKTPLFDHLPEPEIKNPDAKPQRKK